MSSDVLFTPMTETTDCRVNGERLWESLMALAEIGATPKGGCCRLTLTDLDRQGRDLVISWAQAAGMRVTVDKIGNVFMRREGRNWRCRRLSLAAILIPSPPAANLMATTACWRRWRWCAP